MMQFEKRVVNKTLESDLSNQPLVKKEMGVNSSIKKAMVCVLNTG